jgi:hypothetical protein
VVLVAFTSAIFTKPLVAGLAALVASYVEPIVTSLPRCRSQVAYSLIDVASNSLGTGNVGDISGWVLAAALMIEVAVMVLMTVWRMKSVEIAPGAGAQ